MAILLFTTFTIVFSSLIAIAFETSDPPDLGCPECCPQVDTPHPVGPRNKPGAIPKRTGVEVWQSTIIYGINAGCEEDEYRIREYIYAIQLEIEQVIEMNSRCAPRDTPECQASQNWWASHPPHQWMQFVLPSTAPFRESSCLGPDDILA